LIADEMQNCSPEQMKNLLTRIGEGSKLILTGDPKQSDLNKPNGLNDFMNKYKSHSNKEELNSIKIIEFEKSDVVRSKVVKIILNIYKDED
jgi:phosphate starvation-inducible PhoH-like protein